MWWCTKKWKERCTKHKIKGVIKDGGNRGRGQEKEKEEQRKEKQG